MGGPYYLYIIADTSPLHADFFLYFYFAFAYFTFMLMLLFYSDFESINAHFLTRFKTLS